MVRTLIESVAKWWHRVFAASAPMVVAVWSDSMAQGNRLYGDKEKSKPFIEQQRTTLAEVNYFGLDSVAKVVESFEKAHGKGKKLCFLLNIIERHGAFPEDFFSPIFSFSLI